jgi:hypothetical protein
VASLALTVLLLAHRDTAFPLGAAGRGFPEATQFFSNARRRHPRNVEILLARGALLEGAGSRRGRDRARLKRSLSLNAMAPGLEPESVEALVRCGWTLAKRAQDCEAEEALSHAFPLPGHDNLIYRVYRGRMARSRPPGRRP